MWKRQTHGPVICVYCGTLVAAQDKTCYRCERPYPGLFGFSTMLRRFGADLGFVNICLWGCGVLFVLPLLLSGISMGLTNPFDFLSPKPVYLFLFGASGSIPVYDMGRWWTVLSASWLHGSLLHILFNMLWLRQLGPAVAQMFGPGRMVIIYVLGGSAGFILSSSAAHFLPFLPRFLSGAHFTVGASASLFALLGAMVLYGRRAGNSQVGQFAWNYAVISGVLGFLMPGIDNFAHLGGFIGGYGAARILDPMKQERPIELVIGLVLLGVSIAAVVISIVTGLSLLG